MSDLINRQDAIDVARKCPVKEVTPAYMLIDKSEIMTELMLIPSAEPQYKELQDWKTDFKGFIDALDMPRDDYWGIMEYIDEVPSAQPERKKGKVDKRHILF